MESVGVSDLCNFRDVKLLRYLVLIESVLSCFGEKRRRFVKGSLFLGYRLSCLCFFEISCLCCLKSDTMFGYSGVYVGSNFCLFYFFYFF